LGWDGGVVQVAAAVCGKELLMRGLAVTCAVALLLCGCRAPMPSMNLLAPYGTPRIPPPATGAYGAPKTYYQPPQGPPATAPAVGTGLRSERSPAGGWTNADSTAPASRVAQSTSAPARTADDGGVRPASFESLVPVNRAIEPTDLPRQSSAPKLLSASAERVHEEGMRAVPQIRIPNDADAAGSSGMRLKGMPVNDATLPVQSGRLAPSPAVMDISQLPLPAPDEADPPSSTRVSASTTTVRAADAGWRTRPLGERSLESGQRQ
jgi:hypothetical protein